MRDKNMNLEEQNEQLDGVVTETETVANDIEETDNNSGKKKQKAPMGIRPSDKVEKEFKETASKEGLTQTKLFERIFHMYNNKSNEALKEQTLDCTVEFNNIDGAVTTLVNSIKGVVNKAQISLTEKNNEMKLYKETIDKKIELANIDLENKVKELEEKNKKLESDLANSVKVINGFDSIKEDLEYKNDVLRDMLNKKDEEIAELKEGIKERDKAIKSIEKEMDNAAKEVSNIEKEITLLKEERNTVKSNLESSEETNKSLRNMLDSFNAMKQAEIEAIKANEANMAAIKISSVEAIKNAEIEKLNLKIGSLEESIKVLNEKNNDIQSSYKELKELKEQEVVAIKEAESSTYDLKIKDLENKYKSEIDDLNGKIKELENTLSALEEKKKKKETNK